MLVRFACTGAVARRRVQLALSKQVHAAPWAHKCMPLEHCRDRLGVRWRACMRQVLNPKA